MTTRATTAVVQVRRARLDDAAALAPLCGQLGYPSTPEEVERRLGPILADGRHAVYVAEGADGRILGWVHVCEDSTLLSDLHAEVPGLVVEQTRRGLGIGRRLMGQVEQWAREKGFTAVTLRSNVIREQAHAFYEGLGYTVIKTQKAFRKIL